MSRLVYFAFETILSIIFFHDTAYFLVYLVCWDMGLGYLGDLSQVGQNFPNLQGKFGIGKF